jgi:N-acetylmuramic acid 6-phosphate etherase
MEVHVTLSPKSLRCARFLVLFLSIVIAQILLSSYWLRLRAATRLGTMPSVQSQDYLTSRSQFQLHTLLTEQRHPRTWNLSQVAQKDPQAALQQLFAVDEDVANALRELAEDPVRMQRLHSASQAVQKALRDGHRIYFYGTGSTGRLAETLESGLWRPFWQRVRRQSPAWPSIARAMPDIDQRLRGEITGGDRALISSLEGFEDLPLIGELQLHDNGIGADDVVFAVTEGGETSAVIGTAMAAAAQAGAHSGRVWFVYNNPDALLRPFDRSRQVLDDPRIGKLSLPTGPQAITGSTRMQATTTSLYVMGVMLEDALRQLLQPLLTAEELQALAFDPYLTMERRLVDFTGLQQRVAATAAQLAQWTEREAHAYAQGHRATYVAQAALMPVFVDVTERAPTFRLAALDPLAVSPRQSWIQVLAPVDTAAQAWDALLQRPFNGLEKARYETAFKQRIDDPWLRDIALRSLERAGDEQQGLYDLALSEHNRKHNGAQRGDLVALLLFDEEHFSTAQQQWLQEYTSSGDVPVVVSVGYGPISDQITTALPGSSRVIELILSKVDPLGLDRILAMKMLLNAHSTAVMARLGRVVGNTMTAVQPGNLKLIGRATYLIQSHVNAVLGSDAWQQRYGIRPELDYAEANVALFTAIEQRTLLIEAAQIPEVELAVVAVLQSLENRQPVDWLRAARTLKEQRLTEYLDAESH